MRYCLYCEESMHSSNESIWLNGKNYDCHKKCKDSYKEQKESKTKCEIDKLEKAIKRAREMKINSQSNEETNK